MLDYINNLYPMPSSKTIENATNADVCKQKPSIIDQMSDGEQKKTVAGKSNQIFFVSKLLLPVSVCRQVENGEENLLPIQ